jgi:hypothetical protein
MKRPMVEWRSEKNVDGRVMAHLFSLFPFISSEADYLVPEQFSFYGMRLLASRRTPQPGGPGYPSSSGSYRLNRPAWVALPVAALPPA